VQVVYDEFDVQQSKRIILNYNMYETFAFTLEEISQFCYRYQPDGVILKTMKEMSHVTVQLLDLELARRFPNI